MVYSLVFVSTVALLLSAVGCGNLVPPVDAWLRRTDNEATVGCYTTRQRWHLRCQGGQWKGALGQCIDSELPGFAILLIG
jgi:hypothetical protein